MLVCVAILRSDVRALWHLAPCLREGLHPWMFVYRPLKERVSNRRSMRGNVFFCCTQPPTIGLVHRRPLRERRCSAHLMLPGGQRLLGSMFARQRVVPRLQSARVQRLCELSVCCGATYASGESGERHDDVLLTAGDVRR